LSHYLQVLLITICGLALSGSSSWGEPVNRGAGAVTSLDRFSGRILLGEKTPRELRDRPLLHYQVLGLAPGISAAAPLSLERSTLALPLKARGGFVVYELRSGKLTTIIDGRRQGRREGEFWVVRPGENIVLETESDNAVVQTIQIPGS
jgi:hypothetical protein